MGDVVDSDRRMSSDSTQDDAGRLALRVRAGDREAFVTLIRLYQKKVFVVAYSFARNKEDALDLVQETFLRLYEKIGSFRAGHNFEAWLLQIARNLCIDHYRKAGARRRSLAENSPIDEANVADPQAEGGERRRDLREILGQCVNELTDRQRTVFVMRHYEQLKNEEIARTLGLSLGTVKSLHFKAVQNLRTSMSPRLGWER
jgi:RNA polymerase sigma-70 factor (ECF subfamily)